MMGAVIFRFPVEKRVRPTLDLLYEIAPDARAVSLLMESYAIEDPTAGLRDAADRAMAEHIAGNVMPQNGRLRRHELEACLAPLVDAAVSACRAAHDAMSAAAAAGRKLEAARSEGGYWLAAIEQRAHALDEQAARLMVSAAMRCEEAFGAARAVRLAMVDTAWAPRDVAAEAEALFFGDSRTAAR